MPELSEAVAAYHNVAASPEFQELERMRDKASHDEASALHNNSRKIAKNLLAVGIPIDTIAAATGLTREEVEKLRDAK